MLLLIKHHMTLGPKGFGGGVGSGGYNGEKGLLRTYAWATDEDNEGCVLEIEEEYDLSSAVGWCAGIDN